MASIERPSRPLTPVRRLKLSLVSGALFAIIIAGMVLSSPKKDMLLSTYHISPVPLLTTASSSIVYAGQNGSTAVDILKKEHSVEQDASGVVMAIDNKKGTVRQQWNLYVNGTLTNTVEYVTADHDTLEWKLVQQ